MAIGVPSFLNLPMRGPITIAPASAEKPPTAWTTDEPAKSSTPWPRPHRGAELRQPAAAPDPHAVDRVDDSGHEDAHRDERRELPALGHGAGDDRRGGVHEDELEQEEREDADVVGAVAERAEQEALVAEEAPAGSRSERMVRAARRRRAWPSDPKPPNWIAKPTTQ